MLAEISQNKRTCSNLATWYRWVQFTEEGWGKRNQVKQTQKREEKKRREKSSFQINEWCGGKNKIQHQLPSVWFKHLSSLCCGELAPPKKRDARHRNTGRTRRYYQTSTRCFGEKIAALTHDDVETVPKCHSRRLSSFLNPSARRNKVGLSGGYLTPVITERPALQTTAAAASCFLLLSLRNGTADKQLLSKKKLKCFPLSFIDQYDMPSGEWNVPHKEKKKLGYKL